MGKKNGLKLVSNKHLPYCQYSSEGKCVVRISPSDIIGNLCINIREWDSCDERNILITNRSVNLSFEELDILTALIQKRVKEEKQLLKTVTAAALNN